MQISDVRPQTRGFSSVRCPFSPLQTVPVDFRVGPQANAIWGAGPKRIGQIDQTNFLAAGRKSQVRLRNDPTSFSVRDFEAKGLAGGLLSLADCDIDRRIRRMHPALRDQIQRLAVR